MKVQQDRVRTLTIILGAGASVSCGGPTMRDFLDRARNLYFSGRLPIEDVRLQFERVFKAISILQRVHSKAALDIHNIESVFSTFELAEIIAPKFFGEDLPASSLLEAMRVVIAYTLEERIRFECEKNWKELPPKAPKGYQEFISECQTYINADPSLNISIITFNYDVCLDLAIRGRNIEVDYGFNLPERSRISLYKLHGSMNWFRLPEGGLFPVDLDKVRSQPISGTATTKIRVEEIKAHLPGIYRNDPEIMPYIVPPVWNKMRYAKELEEIWQRACAALAQSQYVLVCGYSLPETDGFFKQMFALGSVSNETISEFWVIDPDENVRNRFELSLGEATRSRLRYFGTSPGRHTYDPGTFTHLVDLLRNKRNLFCISQSGV